ncbi:hypothetical protein V8D89_006326 [Ganoderma adspersum]
MDSEVVSGEPPTSAPAPTPHPTTWIDWGLLHTGTDPTIKYPLDREVIQTVAQDIYQMYSREEGQGEGDLSEDEGALEREDGDVEEAPPVPKPSIYVNDGVEVPAVPRKRTIPEDDARCRRHWFPWHDKISCTLDVLMHLPRSVFSQCQLDLFLWLLHVNGVEDIPSVRSMLSLNAVLQRACSVDSIPYKGTLGHNYHVNALDQIITQEMANPRVHPYLHFYPEDTSGKYLAEAWQAKRWLEEVADEVLTPMLRLGSQDFYIHEPALLRDGRICMPVRWFNCVQTGKRVWYAKCWAMEPVARKNGSGWRVIKLPFEIATNELLKMFPELCVDANLYVFPYPTHQTQKEYNIHFLTTSNIALPLEIMDGVIEQLENAQHTGVWAWDALRQEAVLVVPFVLALLGDNPMQSEFACHMGMHAKFFCQNCWVKGHDTSESNEKANGAQSTSHHDDDTLSQDQWWGGESGSETEMLGVESMAAMITCVKAFVTHVKPRSKTKTALKLWSYFETVSVPGGKTTIAKERTASEIKDTFQLVLLEKLFTTVKNKRGFNAKQAAITAAIAELLKNTTNLIWRIKELDAHQDTPVEVLHVVLLDFVKYLWHDLIQVQFKSNNAKKRLIIDRLSLLDVSGLSLSPLVGQTLVAPLVIYDMVSLECYETWVALLKIVPLIWQPYMYNIEMYLATLEHKIQHFLLCAAHWSVQWFNKSKYHVVLHLPEHIQRLGPAALFATEAFDIHSNRQVPSQDIARAFTQGNRICHLLSGGFFMHKPSAGPPSSSVAPETVTVARIPFLFTRSDWHMSTITGYLGLDEKNLPKGQSLLLSRPWRFDTTQASTVTTADPSASTHTVITSQEVIINNDAVLLQQAAIARVAEPYRMPCVDILEGWLLVRLEMRDAAIMQCFVISSPTLAVDDIIPSAVT